MFEKVCKILSEFAETKVDEMTMETLLLSDLDMDSLDTVNAVVRFEDEFNIEVPDKVQYLSQKEKGQKYRHVPALPVE